MNRFPVLAALLLGCAGYGAEPIRSFTVARQTLPNYSRLDASIVLSAPFRDPYDSREIALDAHLTAPSGALLQVPCFFASGTPEESRWGLRFTPREVGTYAVHVTVVSGAVNASSITNRFLVEPSTADGFVTGRLPLDYHFTFDSGKKFRGLGVNFGWEARSSRDTNYTYDAYLPRLSAAGGNTIRTWMCPWNLPLEWKQASGRYRSDTATYNGSAIERTDHLLALAETNRIHIILVLDFHGALRTKPDYWGGNNYWLSHPYQARNGGPCDQPADFFTNAEAGQRYRNRLRYIVARWGWSPNLLAWEFWNEIDNAMADEHIPAPAVVEWHREMAAFLKATDPYGHLVTTSLSHRDVPGLFELKDLDFTQTHLYGRTDRFVSLIRERGARFGKPYVAGEFAFDWRSPKDAQLADIEREFHNGLWRGLFANTPILPLTWWWEYVNDHRLDHHLTAVAAFQQQLVRDPAVPIEPLAVTATESAECYGLRAGREAFVWVHNPGTNDLAQIEVQAALPAAGDYLAQAFDTRNGTVAGSDVLRVSSTNLTLAIPRLKPSQDLAFRLAPR